MSDPLHEAVAAALRLPVGSITEESRPAILPAWDSLANLAVISEVEWKFGVAVELDEAIRIDGVAGWREFLRSKGKL